MLEAREQSLWDAQLKAEALFAAVVDRGLIAPGALESEVSKGVFALARELFGVKRHWHKRVVRCGPNTVLGYYEEVKDRRIGDDDVVYLDFGPVFSKWEADLGRTYALGSDPRKHQLVADIGEAFRLGQAHYEANSALTAGELYDYVAALAPPRGWSFGAKTAGHPVDRFPHESEPGPVKRLSIRSGNDTALREPMRDGSPRHWILEIHFVDRERNYGGFYEELLTIRPTA
ncbi:MAG TPA: M24 family metallopeptidase [Steroidobacteraceae bacterium]|jgi:Xaa-Pro aminopeptidase